MRFIFESLPTWGKFVSMIGLPGVICFILLWILFGSMSDLQAKTDTLVTQLQNHETQRTQSEERLNRVLTEATRVLYVMCQNQAKTDYERDRCLKSD